MEKADQLSLFFELFEYFFKLWNFFSFKKMKRSLFSFVFWNNVEFTSMSLACIVKNTLFRRSCHRLISKISQYCMLLLIRLCTIWNGCQMLLKPKKAKKKKKKRKKERKRSKGDYRIEWLISRFKIIFQELFRGSKLRVSSIGRVRIESLCWSRNEGLLVSCRFGRISIVVVDFSLGSISTRVPWNGVSAFDGGRKIRSLTCDTCWPRGPFDSRCHATYHARETRYLINLE